MRLQQRLVHVQCPACPRATIGVLLVQSVRVRAWFESMRPLLPRSRQRILEGRSHPRLHAPVQFQPMRYGGIQIGTRNCFCSPSRRRYSWAKRVHPDGSITKSFPTIILPRTNNVDLCTDLLPAHKDQRIEILEKLQNSLSIPVDTEVVLRQCIPTPKGYSFLFPCNTIHCTCSPTNAECKQPMVLTRQFCFIGYDPKVDAPLWWWIVLDAEKAVKATCDAGTLYSVREGNVVCTMHSQHILVSVDGRRSHANVITSPPPLLQQLCAYIQNPHRV